jgi:hypothetical protein
MRRSLLAPLALVVLADPVAAHVGALRGSVEINPVPFWLVALTGGGVIGASFLFASLVTDHDLIREVNGGRLRSGLLPGLVPLAHLFGVAALVLVLVTGLFGTQDPVRNPAILIVWVGWWAGFTAFTYLVGNAWPAIDPFRTLTAPLARFAREGVAERLEAAEPWPAAAGLLGLVFVEVVTPVGQSPRLLALAVLAYGVVTALGVALAGSAWFVYADPVSRVFRWYGRMAPVARTDTGLTLRLPGVGLLEVAGDAPFVVALLWATTYDGLVSTSTWNSLVRALVGLGIPALLCYLAALLAGYGAFWWAFRRATWAVRTSADSYLSPRVLSARFAPSLVPIAAGYHLAHFLGYLLALSPALVAVLASPFSPPLSVSALVLPGWFGSVELVFVLLGHVLAVWVAHSIAFDLFVGRLQPIRSQYPLVLAMILYTMTSMWIVAQPSVTPAFT